MCVCVCFFFLLVLILQTDRIAIDKCSTGFRLHSTPAECIFQFFFWYFWLITSFGFILLPLITSWVTYTAWNWEIIYHSRKPVAATLSSDDRSETVLISVIYYSTQVSFNDESYFQVNSFRPVIPYLEKYSFITLRTKISFFTEYKIWSFSLHSSYHRLYVSHQLFHRIFLL